MPDDDSYLRPRAMLVHEKVHRRAPLAGVRAGPSRRRHKAARAAKGERTIEAIAHVAGVPATAGIVVLLGRHRYESGRDGGSRRRGIIPLCVPPRRRQLP